MMAFNWCHLLITILLIFKALVSLAKPELHCMFISSSWAKCIIDVSSCPHCFTTHFKKLIYFNWRLITLEYCGGFCHTLTWISLGYTCVPLAWTPLPPPSPSHPSGLSQCTGFECPVSCVKLGLAIYFTYGNIHVSMLFSQIIPPSHRVQKSVLYICVSFAVSHIGSSLPSF